MFLSKKLYKCLRQKQGAIAIVFGLTLIVLLGFLGLVIDYGYTSATTANTAGAQDASVFAYNLTTEDEANDLGRTREDLANDRGRALYARNVSDNYLGTGINANDITFTEDEESIATNVSRDSSLSPFTVAFRRFFSDPVDPDGRLPITYSNRIAKSEINRTFLSFALDVSGSMTFPFREDSSTGDVVRDSKISKLREVLYQFARQLSPADNVAVSFTAFNAGSDMAVFNNANLPNQFLTSDIDQMENLISRLAILDTNTLSGIYTDPNIQGPAFMGKVDSNEFTVSTNTNQGLLSAQEGLQNINGGVIVLITDGEPTSGSQIGASDNPKVRLADQVEQTCSLIKNNNIVIYTVYIGNISQVYNDLGVYNKVLFNCASEQVRSTSGEQITEADFNNDDKVFYARNAQEFADAITEIVQDSKRLRFIR